MFSTINLKTIKLRLYFCHQWVPSIKFQKFLSGSQICVRCSKYGRDRSGELSGEFSIQSLVDMHGKFVELCHWERRKLYNETDETIN